MARTQANKKSKTPKELREEKRKKISATRKSTRKAIRETRSTTRETRSTKRAAKRTTRSTVRAAKRVKRGEGSVKRIDKRAALRRSKALIKGENKSPGLKATDVRRKRAQRKIKKNTPVTPYKRTKKLNGL